MATPKFSTAAEVALHVLRNKGPKTTHQLHRECLAIPAMAEKPYKAPHHRDFRLRGDQILGETVRPPNPEHLVRSVKYLKQTMKHLESMNRVGHTQIDRWVSWADLAQKSGKATDALTQAKEIEETIKTQGLSPYIWVDEELYRAVKPTTTGVPGSEASKKKKKVRVPIP